MIEGLIAFLVGWGIAVALIADYAVRMLQDGMPMERCVRLVAHYGAALFVESLPPMACAWALLSGRRRISYLSLSMTTLLVVQVTWNRLLLAVCPETCAPNLVGVSDLQNLATTALGSLAATLGLFAFWRLRGDIAA